MILKAAFLPLPTRGGGSGGRGTYFGGYWGCDHILIDIELMHLPFVCYFWFFKSPSPPRRRPSRSLDIPGPKRERFGWIIYQKILGFSLVGILMISILPLRFLELPPPRAPWGWNRRGVKPYYNTKIIYNFWGVREWWFQKWSIFTY